MIAIQIVQIIWTKASRGAPRANARAALPRAFTFEQARAPYVVQQFVMNEAQDFKPVRTRQDASPGTSHREGALTVMLENGLLILGFKPVVGSGKPRREPRSRMLSLNPGETARVLLNARHSSTAGQHYTETIYNVALGSELAPDVFTRAAPTHVIDMLEDLF